MRWYHPLAMIDGQREAARATLPFERASGANCFEQIILGKLELRYEPPEGSAIFTQRLECLRKVTCFVEGAIQSTASRRFAIAALMWTTIYSILVFAACEK